MFMYTKYVYMCVCVSVCMGLCVLFRKMYLIKMYLIES